MSEKKSIIEKVVEEKEEEKRMEEEKQRAESAIFRAEKSEVEKRIEPKKIPLNATAFINSVYSLLKEHQPDYNPLGYYTGDMNWETALSYETAGTAGRITSKIVKKPTLVIEAVYSPVTSITDQILAEAEKAWRNRQFVAECYALDDVDDTISSFVKGFRHPNHSVYLHNISNNELILNDSDEKTVLFSEWFKKDGKPKTIQDIMKEITDENGIFKTNDVEKHLRMNEKEVNRLVEHLMKNNQVIKMKEKEYAFV